MKKVQINIILYTMLHFIVDGLCSLTIFTFLYNEDYTACLIIFLTYNFLAFLTQPIVGLLIDKYNNTKLFLFISILFLLLGTFFTKKYLISAICLGIGNSFFHISGGKYVTCKTKNDIVPLGIFVSTGAIGLILGQKFYSQLLHIIFISLLIVLTLLIILIKDVNSITNKQKQENKSLKSITAILILLMVVLIRSFVGKIVVYDFICTDITLLIISIFIALGKASGGIFVKIFNINFTIIISMVLSIICLVFFNNSKILSMIGIYFFNFSMPITLYLINEKFKNHEGLSFGLLAAVLIPGYLLGMLTYNEMLVKILIIILSTCSLFMIIIVNKEKDKNVVSK